MPTPGPSRTLPDLSAPPGSAAQSLVSESLSFQQKHFNNISATTPTTTTQQDGTEEAEEGWQKKGWCLGCLATAIHPCVLHTGPIHLFWLSSRASTLFSVSSLSCGWQLDVVPAVGGLRQSANYSPYAADQAAIANLPVAVSSIDCSWWYNDGYRDSLPVFTLSEATAKTQYISRKNGHTDLSGQYRGFGRLPEAPWLSRTLPGLSQRASGPSRSSPAMIFAGMIARMSTEVLNIFKISVDTHGFLPNPPAPSRSFPDLPGPTHGALVRERLRRYGNDRDLVWPGNNVC